MTTGFTACTADSIAENEPNFEQEASSGGQDGTVRNDDPGGN